MKHLCSLFVAFSFAVINLAAQNLEVQVSSDEGPQLYNMGFDHWYKHKRTWCLYAESAPESDRIWGTANQGLSLLGKNGVEPEDEIVAVKGKGKRAAKLHSENVLWAFAAGALYNGRFVRIIDWRGAEISWGVPFTSKPLSMEGYYYYIPQLINFARHPYKHLKGTMDTAQIEVLLTDWDKPFSVISNKEQYVDVENDPYIIGRGAMTISKGTEAYVKFNIPIEYRSERTPKYVVIIASASRLGHYFTGGDGSTLYLDEFRFKY